MNNYKFGNYICKLREEHNMTQADLAKILDVSDKAVSKWENGDAKPRIATCYRLASVLGVSINELLSCENYITIPARKELEKLNHKLWKEAYNQLSIYGPTPPAVCWSRLASEEAALRETDAIQGFAIMGKLQAEARKKNTIVLSSGTINSSFAAWLFGGTMVNPLKAHYRCPVCGTVEFVPDVSDGFDLPQKYCGCGAELLRDGHNLPYEGYAQAEQLGTHLEFRISRNFLPTAVKTLKEFYAGVTELLPIKMVSDYNHEAVDRYVILPENKARPTLSADGFWHVSMDDYWDWQENETSFTFLVSEQLTRLDQQNVENNVLPDPITLMTPQLAKVLHNQRKNAVPHVYSLLQPDNNQSFHALLRIDGWMHGTCEWDAKKQPIPEEVISHLPYVPTTREDIWNTISVALEQNGIRDDGLALLVMEKARKGLFLSKGMPANIAHLLLSIGLPEWYSEYLSKIMYLFPKGHCVAFLLIEALLAWTQNFGPKSEA